MRLIPLNDPNAPFRDPQLVQAVLKRIKNRLSRHWVIMEMCGGQTNAILKHGIDQLLEPEIEFVHGPGCPVCVTPVSLVDQAIALAAEKDVILASYGDMLRVPGSRGSLAGCRAAGADVRVVYAALDALALARANPNREVVFFGIGFETTAPANGISILEAARLSVFNFTVIVSQFCVPPALEMILNAPDNHVQGFLAAGHVCAVMGLDEYRPLCQRFRVPISVTGFEPLDLLLGVEQIVRDLEADTPQVSNAYPRSVADKGNPQAQKIITQLFEPADREWRGIGTIPNSGWKLKDTYAQFDASVRFGLTCQVPEQPDVCMAGMILQGKKTPPDCPAFARQCTPDYPLGATMVSGEGACAAWYRYRRSAKYDLSA